MCELLFDYRILYSRFPMDKNGKWIYYSFLSISLQVSVCWETLEQPSTPLRWATAMMTSSNRNIFRLTGSLWGEFTVTSEFPSHRPVMRGFDVFFDLCLYKWLSKHSRCWWFETPSRPLWRHCNDKWHMGVVGTPIGASGWWHYNDIIMSAMASQIISLECLFNCLFRRRSKKTSKLRVTGLCEGNSPITGEFPSQRVTKAGKVSSWWRHHVEVHLDRRLIAPLGVSLYFLYNI